MTNLRNIGTAATRKDSRLDSFRGGRSGFLFFAVRIQSYVRDKVC